MIERACEKACSAPVSSPMAAARLPRHRARASNAEPSPRSGTAAPNSSRARSASPRRPRPTRASASNALQLSTPGRPPTPGGPAARTGSAASITPAQSPWAKANDVPAMAAASGGQRPGEALGRRPRRSDVRTGGGPLPTEGEDLGGTGVRPSEVNRAVGVHGQRSRQLCIRHRGVPVAAAEVCVAQIRQAHARVAGGQAVAEPGGGDAEVGDSAGQIVDVELQHAPHDHGVGRCRLHLAPGRREQVQRRQPIGAPTGGGQGKGLGDASPGVQCRPWEGALDCSISPHERLVRATGDDHPVRQRCRRPRPDLRLRCRIVALPCRYQAVPGVGRPGVNAQQPGQRVTAGAAGSASRQRPRRAGVVRTQ